MYGLAHIISFVRPTTVPADEADRLKTGRTNKIICASPYIIFQFNNSEWLAT